MTYPGGKNGSGVYQKIISQMPKHTVYIEAFLGGGAILRNKKPAVKNIGIEIDPEVRREFWKDSPFDSNLEIWAEDFCHWIKYGFSFGQYKPKDVLIYADPPYLQSVRRSQRQIYRYELMKESEHIELLQNLKTQQCNVMISGYESELYNEMLSTWRKTSFTGFSRAGATTEIVWMNFPEPLELHDYSFLGDDYRKRQDIKRKKQRWTNKLRAMQPQERYALLSAFEELKFDLTTAETPSIEARQ